LTVAGHRHERIAEEIMHEVGSMLEGELKDPRLAIVANVTEVRVSPDLRQARIYVNVAGNEEDEKTVLAGLTAAEGFIRHELAERLQLRRRLELFFVLDKSEEYGHRIEELLKQTRKTES
jgi:ribosome-binding factor A